MHSRGISIPGAALATALLCIEAHAMKVAPPEVSRYADASGKVTLEIPTPRSEQPARLHAGQTHVWAGRTPVPERVVFVPQRELVALIGGLGDPGVSLGHVELRAYDGTVRAHIELAQKIPDLEALSTSWQDDMGNFPWVGAAAASPEGDALVIDVCGKYLAVIDTQSFIVDVSRRSAPGAPRTSRAPPRPVLPLELDGVRYDPALGDARHLPTNSIAAYDVRTGRELWRLEVYRQQYVPELETDVQDAFITRLEVDPQGRGLVVTNERGRRYLVDVKARTSTRLP